MKSSTLSEEHYWRQRARTEWLKAGDANIKFFHNKATQRRKKNAICGIEDETGMWKDKIDDIVDVVENYFRHIFFTNTPFEAEINLATTGLESRVTDEQNALLLTPFIDKDIKTVVFRMGPAKASGPDGFQTIFYQKNWSIVGGRVTRLCL
ncbi:hypothetical protein PanWU01x14_370990 [Parasponia andersonii]|uniref:Endonuclease/exonuclease/phosphatase n=1 Tax=Parasponia andersonii TaxID=3476 RepID=A0A2P5A419_PARAD|nr:hypothetical protein PanWU01x14_370990 [Parasponia andersonii]